MQNNKEQLKSFLEERVPIADEDWTYIEGLLEPLEFEKGKQLTLANQVEENLYFICSGLAILLYEKEDRDITINIGFPNGFISSYSSFLTQEKSEFTLRSLTPISLIRISKNNLESIYHSTSSGQQLGRLFAEQFFIYVSQRETDFMLRSPTERYLSLFDEQPHLIKEIPLKYLASYIGITPQALSRIRAKIN